MDKLILLKQLRSKLTRSKINLSKASDAKTRLIDSIVILVNEYLIQSTPSPSTVELPEEKSVSQDLSKKNRERVHVLPKHKPNKQGIISKSGTTIMTPEGSEIGDNNNPMTGGS
jgi:hypothetical protein